MCFHDVIITTPPGANPVQSRALGMNKVF